MYFRSVLIIASKILVKIKWNNVNATSNPMHNDRKKKNPSRKFPGFLGEQKKNIRKKKYFLKKCLALPLVPLMLAQ